MGNQRSKKDILVLKSLAEYRILSVRQMAALHFSSLQMARRKRRELEEKGLIEIIHRGFGKSGGRPEGLIYITKGGIARLQKERILQGSIKPEEILMQNSSSREHQLLLNWVCIHVRHLKSAISDLTTDFLLSTSTFFDSSGSKVPHPRDRVRLNNADDKQTSFLPDGVFFIKSIKPKKALLFFVEIDMSTETIAHFKNSEKDVLQKIINYQAYFRAGGYKRYESHWNCRFKGFRLLIITNKPSRVEALSRLVAQTPPSDFIWLTDQKSLHSQGISDRIWVRGGRAERSLESIVGPTLAVPSAIPIKS